MRVKEFVTRNAPRRVLLRVDGIAPPFLVGDLVWTVVAVGPLLGRIPAVDALVAGREPPIGLQSQMHRLVSRRFAPHMIGRTPLIALGGGPQLLQVASEDKLDLHARPYDLGNFCDRHSAQVERADFVY